MRGVDASHRLDGAAVAAAGFGFAFRYESTAALPKDDSPAEIADLLAHGVAVGHVFEDNTTDLTQGPVVAQDKAATAVAHAQALGIPAGCALFLTCDQPTPPVGVVAAMQAAAAVIRQGSYLAGFYGPKAEARLLIGKGAIDATWVVDTWGLTFSGDVWNFRQLPNAGQPTVGGVQCDVNDAPAPVGLWLPAPVVVPPPSPPVPVTLPTGEPGMQIDIKVPIGTNGIGHAPVPGVPVAKVASVRFNGAVDANGTPLERAAPTWDADDIGGTAQINVYGSIAQGGIEACTVWAAT